MSILVTPSPAKINLFLKVVGKREDGYHELISLICRIDLFDTVALAFEQPNITVHCSHPKVPTGEGNLVYQAACLFFEAVSKSHGVAIFIKKVIPVAAGLGGGSSNAASVLVGLNQHYGFPLSDEDLMDMGLKVGADVPFFLLRHTAIAKGIGEDLEVFEGMPQWSAVLVWPRFEVSTAWVYQNLNLRLTNCKENYKVLRFMEDPSQIKDLLCNDLEQVTVREFSEISTVKKALLDLGAEGALMSGSGPSVFGLFRAPQQASMAFQTIKHQGRWDTFMVQLLAP